MDIKISIGAESLEKVRDAFRKFPDIIAPFLRNASQTAAFAIEREAKILSPVDTGRLRASIATSLGIANKGIQSVVQTNVNYAVYVHEGTRFMKGRPFMQQGVDASKPVISFAYEDQIRKALELLRG